MLFHASILRNRLAYPFSNQTVHNTQYFYKFLIFKSFKIQFLSSKSQQNWDQCRQPWAYSCSFSQICASTVSVKVVFMCIMNKDNLKIKLIFWRILWWLGVFGFVFFFNKDLKIILTCQKTYLSSQLDFPISFPQNTIDI